MTLTTRITTPELLTPREIQAWSDIQRAEPAFDSPYFHPEFTRAVGRVRSDVEVAVIEQAGEPVGFLPYQRGALGIGKPVGGKLSDYQGVIARAEVPWSPQQLLRDTRLACYDFDHLLASQTAFESHATETGKSPYLDLSSGYDTYCRARKQAGTDVVARTMQKSRKLEREVGPLEFVAHTADKAILETLRRWKSAQYLQSGLSDVFAFPWTGALLEDFMEHPSDDFSPLLSMLTIHSRPVAITYSLRAHDCVHSWFTAYDKEFAAYSPGVILFLRLAQEAERLGISKIDLGKGDERYKWSLASASTDLLEGSVRGTAVGLLLRDGWRKSRDWMPTTARWMRPLREWLAFR